MKQIDMIAVTPEMRRALRLYEIACTQFSPGSESTSVVELPLIALGTLMVQAVGLPTMQQLFDMAMTPNRARRR